MRRPLLLQSRPGRVVAALTALLTLSVAVGLVALWPDAESGAESSPMASDSEQAVVVGVSIGECEEWAGPGCQLAEIELRSGPSQGRKSTITLPDDRTAPRVAPGDKVRVARNIPFGVNQELAEQLPLDDPSQQPFAFIDFERSRSLLALVLGFGALVILLGRWHGVRALIGLTLSLAIVIEFLAPAMLEGHPPLLVALVGSLAVMLITLTLAHGAGLKSLAAILGTATALALTALLAVAAVRAADITGFSSEQSLLALSGVTQDVSLQGLVVAGMVIGALGVLDDVTVSQASTVLALRRANPALQFRRLFGEALAVGRDHLGATINTLVLAYVGAALPVLLIFNTSGTPFTEAVNREPVAEQVVAMLVGSIGLIAAVPLTTAVAALLASKLPAEALTQEDRTHLH
jgi:uncharacterized membrane protein